MAKPKQIELPDGTIIPILHEDRAVLAIDKPAGWLLAPESCARTSRNLQLALISSIQAGDDWARVRGLKYIRFVHRLDADTSGVVLFVKHPGAVHAYSRLFELRRMVKVYLAVVRGIPRERHWVCRLKLAPDRKEIGRMKVDARRGQEAETQFHVLQSGPETALIDARPLTGRTHQIRVHLAESGHPVLGDRLYGPGKEDTDNAPRAGNHSPMALRAAALNYQDPFQKKPVCIEAPIEEFCRRFGFRVDRSRSGAERSAASPR